MIDDSTRIIPKNISFLYAGRCEVNLIKQSDLKSKEENEAKTNQLPAPQIEVKFNGLFWH